MTDQIRKHLVPEPKKISLYYRLVHFFPVQLLLLHIKRNHLMMILWLLMFSMVMGGFGAKYGIHYLFAYPEYLGKVSPVSYAILGFACGGFIMSFHIYSYLLLGWKFRFMPTIARPFFKFCINNSLLPLIFLLVYLYKTWQFQRTEELLPAITIVNHQLSFIGGFVVFVLLSMGYFLRLNHDVIKLKLHRPEKELSDDDFLEKTPKDTGYLKVRSYLSSPFKVSLARFGDHYDKAVLDQIARRNRLNANIFELIVVASFIFLGVFKDSDWVLIPAAASIFLLFTILSMLTSIFVSWFKGWSFTVAIILFLGVNYVTNYYDVLRYKSYAYGLDYTGELADYSFQNISKLAHDTLTNREDADRAIVMLENWKKRTGQEKPYMVIIATSGGGIRSTAWTYQIMQELDKRTNGKFMQSNQLISGSSGGMLGAAFYRELYLRDQIDEKKARFQKKYFEQITSDLLNPVSFSIATSDIFFRLQNVEENGKKYTRDRGYDFERHLHKNTDYIMDKSLNDYTQDEFEGKIPLMLLAPSIVNDGRRLLISSQPVSYLCNYDPDSSANHEHIENVEFQRMFKKQGAKNLRFSSALRMNATFPYIMPMSSMPSEPAVEIIDAGFRDNYGIKLMVSYLSEFQTWIEQNTAGIIIVQIRDTKKDFEIKAGKNRSLLSRITTPVGNVIGNYLRAQDFNNDQLILEFSKHFKIPIHNFHFSLIHDRNENVSMSWHLTNYEKRKVQNAVDFPHNKKSIEQLCKILEQ